MAKRNVKTTALPDAGSIWAGHVAAAKLAPNHRLNAGELDALIAFIRGPNSTTQLMKLSSDEIHMLSEACVKLELQRDLLK